MEAFQEGRQGPPGLYSSWQVWYLASVSTAGKYILHTAPETLTAFVRNAMAIDEAETSSQGMTGKGGTGMGKSGGSGIEMRQGLVPRPALGKGILPLDRGEVNFGIPGTWGKLMGICN